MYRVWAMDPYQQQRMQQQNMYDPRMNPTMRHLQMRYPMPPHPMSHPMAGHQIPQHHMGPPGHHPQMPHPQMPMPPGHPMQGHMNMPHHPMAHQMPYPMAAPHLQQQQQQQHQQMQQQMQQQMAQHPMPPPQMPMPAHHGMPPHPQQMQQHPMSHMQHYAMQQHHLQQQQQQAAQAHHANAQQHHLPPHHQVPPQHMPQHHQMPQHPIMPGHHMSPHHMQIRRPLPPSQVMPPPPLPARFQQQQASAVAAAAAAQQQNQNNARKKKKYADKLISSSVRMLVPESEAYMDLLAFEQKLEACIKRKRQDFQEGEERPTPMWELRVEGRLLDEPAAPPQQPARPVIELDKSLYGPENHLVEWHRTATTGETDGFQVKRPGGNAVKCTILLLLDHQPLKFKLHPRLAKLLGIPAETRPKIIEALWQYIKMHKLQTLHHVIHPNSNATNNTQCYDIDVDVDDPIRHSMQHFMHATSNQQEIMLLDQKIHDLIDNINEWKLRRDFYVRGAHETQDFLRKWLISQSVDLSKAQGQSQRNREDERQTEFYSRPDVKEAVNCYKQLKMQHKRAELETSLGIRGTS